MSADTEWMRWWTRPPTMREKAAHRFYAQRRERHAKVRALPYPARRRITGLLALLSPEAIERLREMDVLCSEACGEPVSAPRPARGGER